MKLDFVSKNYCLSIYELMSFFWILELGYWIDSRDTEINVKIIISRFSETFPYNLQGLFSSFLFFFELIDLQGPIDIFQALQI